MFVSFSSAVFFLYCSLLSFAPFLITKRCSVDVEMLKRLFANA